MLNSTNLLFVWEVVSYITLDALAYANCLISLISGLP